uniref:Restriction endonuclease type IV Mrr domain-containing protein n=1 Tax=Panagrolaimus sp. ES5 TaxID=591445 RepID=A0AC34FGT0_9BILA
MISPKSPSIINEYISDEKSPITTSSGFASTSDFSPYETASPNDETPSVTATTVTFLFKNDETCAVEILQNGRRKKLKNIFDNEWTPLYFSMAQPTPEIGEKAQIHCHQFREHVLYDIFKVIGIPINEIEYDPEWKFKVVMEKGIKCFQIKTQKGLQSFPEHIIVGIFLKSMKKQAENYLNSEIHEVVVTSNFDITESQKYIFKNAASKVHLKILSFNVNTDFE